MLKKILPIATILFSMNCLAVDLPSSKEELLSKFISAHESKDFEKIAALINWKDVSKYKRKIVRVYTKNNFGRKVVDSEFKEADTEFLRQFSIGSKDYRTNMDVTHLMRLYFEDTNGSESSEYDSVVYLVGEHAGKYQISITVKNNTSGILNSH